MSPCSARARARPDRVFPGRFLVMPVSVFLSSGFFFLLLSAFLERKRNFQAEA